MRFHRETFLDLVTFRSCERQMFSELFGLLVGLDQEWMAQGASSDERTLQAFDWDYVPFVECGGNTGALHAGPPVIIHEDAEVRLERDYLGRTLQLCKSSATVPLPLDFPVKTADDWLRLKPLFLFSEERVDWKAVEAALERQREGALVVGRIPGGWDIARELMGDAMACLTYYDQPELMRDILDTLGRTATDRLSSRMASCL